MPTTFSIDLRFIGAFVLEESVTQAARAGSSPRPTSPPTSRVLDALGHERACVAGYDLVAGGAVAFARNHPARILRLAVMEFVLAGFGPKAAMAPKPGWNAGSN